MNDKEKRRKGEPMNDLISRQTAQWTLCDDRLPELYSRVILLYSNGLISGGTYRGNKEFNVDYPDADKGVRVKAWAYEPGGNVS